MVMLQHLTRRLAYETWMELFPIADGR